MKENPNTNHVPKQILFHEFKSMNQRISSLYALWLTKEEQGLIHRIQ